MCKGNIRNDVILEKIKSLMKSEGIDIYEKNNVIKSLAETVCAKENIKVYMQFISEVKHEKLTTCDSVR